ncbi:hypothetical protein [Pontibacter vulgaris]|uniref:hypothetical protein n=1 Tax=Pontibacter vulgaris TaxID=2905679 RepID=UPI001FA7BAE5|nr:hypothetical protein [Pontibacter vulgaris]
MDLPENSEEIAVEVLHNDYVTITWFKADSLILLKWLRQIDFDERKETFLWAYQFSIDNQVKNWLIDDEEIYIITTAEREWIESEWTKIVAGSGIAKIAVYIPASFYSGLITLTDFTQNAQNNYKLFGTTEHEVFTDYETALTWLKSK